MTMKSAYSNFRIEAALKTPAILRGYITLESLLAAAVNERTGLMRDEALAQVPITSALTPEGVLWSASAFFFGSIPKVISHTVVRRRRRDEIGPDFFDGNPRSKKNPFFVEQSRDDFCALLNIYRAFQVESLVWYAHGDAGECARLLSSLISIGKRRGEGFGQLGNVSVTAVSHGPLTFEDGTVTRPIPLKMMPYLETNVATTQRIETTSSVHPVWLNNACECAVPGGRIAANLPCDQVENESGELFFA